MTRQQAQVIARYNEIMRPVYDKQHAAWVRRQATADKVRKGTTEPSAPQASAHR